MVILVTGGAGLIGSHVVDNLSTGSREQIHPAAQLLEMDINQADLVDVLLEERPEAVNHASERA